MHYINAMMARLYYLVALLRYCGTAEGSAMHKAILTLYNQIDPLPRGHRAVLSDDWCAIFMSAIAHALGYRGWPLECSCSMIIQQATVQDRWHRAGNYIPQLGDWCIYDWGPNGKVDHIGAVCWIEGNYLWVVEGNNGDAVRVRRIAANDATIYGYVELDFGELVGVSAEDIEALRPGDKSDRVRFLQGTLAGYGYYTGALDGSYGPLTTQAVTAFQAANGLEQDGLAGPKTMSKIIGGDVVTIDRPAATIKEVENTPTIYNTIEEVPEYARETINKLIAAGVLKGTGAGLGLDDGLLRALVIIDRLGLIPG